MCLEDLRLGKGRVPQKPTQIQGVATNQELVKADSRRVALFLTFTGAITVDPGTGNHTPATCTVFADDFGQTLPIATLNTYNGILVLRIEDVGQLLSYRLTVTVADSSGFVAITTAVPIISNVDAPPVFSGRP